ncbi:MAG TPA: protein kinase [Polyangium sp.]|nr:protein kinase [Polyangium sp.]
MVGIGTILSGKYRLVRCLGQGGMGTVYAAEDSTTGQTVAIKLLDPRLLEGGADNLRRFRREARAASAIKNEHIVRIFDTGGDENQGQPYIAMELLEGEDLQQVIDRIGPLPPETVAIIGVQALKGLAAAHEARIVHRDIKPSNLFLARQADGTRIVKLLDFGIAKMQSDPAKAQHSAGMTATGDLLGSPLYMSPEQVMSTKDVDARSDIWSLGSVLYCALAGFAPHIESSAAVGRLLVTICSKPIPPLRERAPWVPENFAHVIAPALERAPDQRYPSAAAMVEALAPYARAGTPLPEEMLIRANTGEHFVARPMRASLAADGDDATLPANDDLGRAATKLASAATNPVSARGKPDRRKWLAGIAIIFLLVTGVVWGLNQNHESTNAGGPAPILSVAPSGPTTNLSSTPAIPAAAVAEPLLSAAASTPETLLDKATTSTSAPRGKPSAPTSASPIKKAPQAPTGPKGDPLFERNAKVE